MILICPFCCKNLIDNLSSFSCESLAAKHVVELCRNSLTSLRQLQGQELLSIVNCLGKKEWVNFEHLTNMYRKLGELEHSQNKSSFFSYM